MLALATVLLAEVPLGAYLDPGSGSMLVQLLLGGVAGVAVMLRSRGGACVTASVIARTRRLASAHDD